MRKPLLFATLDDLRVSFLHFSRYMIRNFLFFVVVFLTFPALSQNRETRTVESFKSIRVIGAADVRLMTDSPNTIKIEYGGMNAAQVFTDVSNEELRIDIKGQSFSGRPNLDIQVGYREIQKIYCSGACSIYIPEKLKASNLYLEVSSAGNIELEVATDELKIEAATAGQLTISGSTKEIRIEGSTSAIVDASNLTTENAVVHLRTASSAKLNVLKALTAEVATAGSLRFKGNPSKTNLQSATGGSIRKVD